MISLENIKFNNDGLIPVVAQDDQTKEVVMLAYMNIESIKKSIETGLAHYWSRSRQELWLKGETSGNFQHIKSMSLDCDEDALLIIIEQKGAACHTGSFSCFFNKVIEKADEAPEGKTDNNYIQKSKILKELYEVVSNRKKDPLEGSYTNYLFEKGIDKILKKVGEETSEVIIAAKNASNDELRYEISDLIYHLIVSMVERDVKLEDIFNELEGRKK